MVGKWETFEILSIIKVNLKKTSKLFSRSRREGCRVSGTGLRTLQAMVLMIMETLLSTPKLSSAGIGPKGTCMD